LSLFLGLVTIYSVFGVSKNAEMLDNYLTKEIVFSGITWKVRSGTGNPGNNKWSDSSESVWVDENGILHLKIRRINGLWYCSEIYSDETVGYGEYRFYVASNVENLDKNIVVGLFTYFDDENEIDIEFSKWGNEAETEMGNYATQPATIQGNSLSFELGLNGSYSTHRFIWKPNEIDYKSWHGHEKVATETTLIQNWKYTGANIPSPGNEELIINAWLYKGLPPNDGQEAEILIKSVRVYKPPVIADQEISIPENTPVASILDSLNTPGFLPDELDFVIEEGNEDGLFSISETGKIILEKELDYEKSAIQNLTVVAQKGDMTDTARITINIENVNDNAPSIKDTLFQVSEDLPVESVIGALVFNDADGDSVTFSIVSGNDEGIYSIAADGEIVLKQSLDYGINRFDTLSVIASDGLFAIRVKVVVEINNVIQQSSVLYKQMERISVYPNPVCDVLNIEFGTESNFIVSILSLDGKYFTCKEISREGRFLSLDISNLTSGVYIVGFENESAKYSSKFVKN
jgi:hypothetical protein